MRQPLLISLERYKVCKYVYSSLNKHWWKQALTRSGLASEISIIITGNRLRGEQVREYVCSAFEIWMVAFFCYVYSTNPTWRLPVLSNLTDCSCFYATLLNHKPMKWHMVTLYSRLNHLVWQDPGSHSKLNKIKMHNCWVQLYIHVEKAHDCFAISLQHSAI